MKIQPGCPNLIKKYRFTLEAIEKITLPAYKGSTFHGGFGRALNALSPHWYRYFYEPGSINHQDWPKPFVLLPPLTDQEVHEKGQQFSCELTLFGEAIEHHAICEAAIEYLGMQMGLGYTRGKYKVIDVHISQPENQEAPARQQVTLDFRTRLRIKANNHLYRQPPPFQVIASRLLGRLKTLQLAYCHPPPATDYYQGLLEKSAQITIKNSSLRWDDWDRFSGRQKQWMKFGGLLGKISYSGNLEPFIDYLILGEWLHIGNKTSFGLGKYTIEETL